MLRCRIFRLTAFGTRSGKVARVANLQGKGDGNGRSGVQLAFYLDFSFHLGDQIFGDGHTKSGAGNVRSCKAYLALEG